MDGVSNSYVKSHTVQQIKDIVSLDEQSGLMTFKFRHPESFRQAKYSCDRTAKAWNTRNVGNFALNTPMQGRYLHGTIDGVFYRAHRVVWAVYNGRWPSCDIDHINGNGFDNRPENLRESLHTQNLSNRGRNQNNTSGVKGVTFDKQTGRWIAQIGVNGKNIKLGRFVRLEDAKLAREQANEKYHKDFARMDWEV